MKRDERVYLDDIIEAAEKALSVEGHDARSFRTDDRTVYAVTRALEVIGEAAK